MSISSSKSDEGTNQNMNSINSINAMNGLLTMHNLSTPASLNGKQNGQQQNSTNGQQQNNENGTPKPVIERGASWSYNETRILLR